LVNVTKRPFTSNGVHYAAGTVITDPAAIRLFRSKVNDGKVIKVDEHNLDSTIAYFSVRVGVDVAESLTAAVKGTVNEPVVEPVADVVEPKVETKVETKDETKPVTVSLTTPKK
jgi:hypothetical protein